MKYHYTTGGNTRKIMEDKLIRPTELFLEHGERGVAWFTTRVTFEPTALPVWEDRQTKVRRELTLTEAAELGGGLYRFGLPDDHPQHSELYPWLKICRLARTPKKAVQALHRVARKMGSDPFTYWGSLSPISIFGCTFEKSMDGITWHCGLSETLAASAGK
jgi:hypothetical protein